MCEIHRGIVIGLDIVYHSLGHLCCGPHFLIQSNAMDGFRGTTVNWREKPTFSITLIALWNATVVNRKMKRRQWGVLVVISSSSSCSSSHLRPAGWRWSSVWVPSESEVIHGHRDGRRSSEPGRTERMEREEAQEEQMNSWYDIWWKLAAFFYMIPLLPQLTNQGQIQCLGAS